MKRIAATVLLCAATATAHAQKPFNWNDLIGPAIEHPGLSGGFFSGDELYRRGRDYFTVGYVVAVFDTDTNSYRSQTYCVPEGVSARQVADVAWRFLEQNPQNRHLSAAHLVRQSFAAAWPCPAK